MIFHLLAKLLPLFLTSQPRYVASADEMASTILRMAITLILPVHDTETKGMFF